MSKTMISGKWVATLANGEDEEQMREMIVRRLQAALDRAYEEWPDKFACKPDVS